jgi:hypothetical protein
MIVKGNFKIENIYFIELFNKFQIRALNQMGFTYFISHKKTVGSVSMNDGL